ncbi:MAG: ATP-binding protein [Anaerolineae bacterium]|nr:ATP-binding protein [Anaerolineae bacterium]
MKGIYEQPNSALALGRISARLNAQLDLQTVLHTVCEESALAMDADMSSVRLHDPATNTLPVVAQFGIDQELSDQRANSSAQVFEALMNNQNGTVLVIPDVQKTDMHVDSDFYKRLNIRSMMIAGMWRYNELIGILTIANTDQPHNYSKDEELLLANIAEQSAQAISNANLYETAQRRAQELQLLDKVRVAVVRELDLDAIIRTVGEATAQAFGYNLVCTYKVDGDELDLMHQVGWKVPLLRIPIGSGIMGRVARTRQPAFVQDVTRDPDLVNPAPGAVSEICVPLVDHGKTFGVLNIESDRRLTRDDFDLIKAVGEEVNIAIGRARLYEEAKNQRDFALTVMGAMGEGLAVLDADYRFTYVNATLAHMMAVEPEDWVIHKTDHELFEGVTHELAVLHRRVRNGAQYRCELRRTRPDGIILPIRVTATPRFVNDVFAGYIAVVTDLTDEARIREAAMIARDQALTAAKLRAEFIARLSHELRTPMNGILGMAELLSDSGLNPEQREMAETVYECGQSLMYLINDLLDFSKIEAGKMQLDIAHFEINSVVTALNKLFLPKMQGKGLYFKIKLDPKLPRFVLGDANRLRQILTNLIGNAIKFTEEGGVTLRITPIEGETLTPVNGVKPYYDTIPAQTTTPVWMRFEVADTGIGLSEQMRTHLFQPFTQGDMTITRRFGGTGLGLAICKNLVGLMNGDIDVKSIEGKGSTFWFTAQFGASDVDLH